ncbi:MULTISPECIES: hypothetical protein [unclassified Streptomyces]|uniref:hypothetical protein n=1 Tax=unclassified Streptomyces TaxID=2593676 RepID=UPI0003691C8D|nr:MULTISPECIES: hypothetical protein [unclassified Streptomyces]MYX32669.1 hypothetical protein [Streptomyces sp. SID8377]
MRASVVPVPTIADLAIRALPWDPAEHLNQAARRMRGRQSRTLGFPGNANVDLSAYGSRLSVLFNNVGDPQSTDASNIGAKTYELAVLEYFAHVAGADPAQVSRVKRQGPLSSALRNSAHQPAICQPSVRSGSFQEPSGSFSHVGPRKLGSRASISFAVRAGMGLTSPRRQCPGA